MIISDVKQSDKKRLSGFLSLVCLGVMILMVNIGFAQAFSDNLKVGANYHYGYSLPEYSVFNYLVDAPIRSAEITLAKESYGRKDWEQIYKYPEHGISLFYSTLGNREILGEEIALTYFFKAHLMEKGKFRVFNRTGIGLSYVTKEFNLETNYLNVAVGSHFNIHFNTRFGVNYQFNPKWEGNVGLSFDHFSNANTNEPNLGINYVTGYLGVAWIVGDKKERISQEIEPHIKRNYLRLFASGGGKHTRSLSSEYYPTISLCLEGRRELTRSFHAGVGVDLFYDSSVKNQLESEGSGVPSTANFQSGLHAGFSITYHRFSLGLHQGVYLGFAELVEGNKLYNRGFMQWQVSDQMFVRLAMKSHLHILDYPEIGFGITL